MIKLSLSITLLAAIFTSYYLVGSLVGKTATVPVNTLDFTEGNSEIKRLEALSAYEAISQSPLFDADREPAKKEIKKKVVQKKQVKQDLLVKALGIAVTGESILAVVKDMKSGKILRLRVNEKFNGWTLKGVSKNSFVFFKDEAEKAIRFKNNGD